MLKDTLTLHGFERQWIGISRGGSPYNVPNQEGKAQAISEKGDGCLLRVALLICLGRQPVLRKKQQRLPTGRETSFPFNDKCMVLRRGRFFPPKLTPYCLSR